MEQLQPLSVIHAGSAARDRYRWLLLSGWFILIATVLSVVTASSSHITPESGIEIGLAALAFVVYNIAIRRYWIFGLLLLFGLVAAMVWIVSR